MVMISKSEIFNQIDMSLEAAIDDLLAKNELDRADLSIKARRLLIRLASMALFRAALTYGVTVDEAEELSRDCVPLIMKDKWRTLAKLATNTSSVPN